MKKLHKYSDIDFIVGEYTDRYSNAWSTGFASVTCNLHYTKMMFFIKDFFSKCDQIRSFLRIWSCLLKKSLMENFCAVLLNQNSDIKVFLLLESFISIFPKIFNLTIKKGEVMNSLDHDLLQIYFMKL